MKPSIALEAHREEIRLIIEAHHASNARVFGSVARGEDTDESDLDLLIDPTPDTTLFDLGAIRRKLRALLGVPVDVLTSGAIPDRKRDAILGSALPV
ncbi:nucleotidyltransferase family protein [Caballeronia arvi]|uniref:nucleotidyltransferase family protein n=1 Tax=Caballeronia arvi TaxID=1777135 RepID=UPI000772AB4B|nr:nucleotidyltransferase family protein [Caballeronia arvi]